MIEETEIGQRRSVSEALQDAIKVTTVSKVLESKRSTLPFLKREPTHLQGCGMGHASATRNGD